ncbi:MAG: flagellar motor switch protein FliM [Gammaproteobacteria bacterium]|nr:flagellar motor switch protein FliM [Gammaproteobacteria bacterium]
MAGSEILSQDEIDALLSGVDSGEVEVETGPEPAGESGKAYDFTSQDRIVRGRMPTLEMINDRFARNIRQSLFNMFRRSPDVSCEGVQMMKFGEYVHTLVVPTNLNIVKVPPLRGYGLVVLNPKLIFALVDCFFGGNGGAYNKVEGREFTETEMRIVKRVLQLIFADLKSAWAPVLPVNFEYLNTEHNPQFANIVSPSEVVVVSTFHIDMEGGSGYVHVTMPYSMLEPLREILDAGIQSEVEEKDERWATGMRDQIKLAKVKIHSTLARTQLSLRDVTNLKVGDIIQLDLPTHVVARAQGVPIFKAKYGVSRGNLALRVADGIKKDELIAMELIPSNKQ